MFLLCVFLMTSARFLEKWPSVWAAPLCVSREVKRVKSLDRNTCSGWPGVECRGVAGQEVAGGAGWGGRQGQNSHLDTNGCPFRVLLPRGLLWWWTYSVLWHMGATSHMCNGWMGPAGLIWGFYLISLNLNMNSPSGLWPLFGQCRGELLDSEWLPWWCVEQI